MFKDSELMVNYTEKHSDVDLITRPDVFSRRVPYGAWLDRGKGKARFFLAKQLTKAGLSLVIGEGARPRAGQKVQLKLVVENEERVITFCGKIEKAVNKKGDTSFNVRFCELDAEQRLFLTDLYDEACGY